MEAGIEELGERFGAFATLDSLSESLRLPYAEVLKLSANTCLTKLRYEQARAAYQRRLSKIQQPQQR